MVVAIMKCHQPLNKILICLPVGKQNFDLFTCTSSKKSPNGFIRKKTLSCNTPVKLDAILWDQHALVMHAWVSYIFNIHLTEFSCKQLCWYPGCLGKNNLNFVQSLVAYFITANILLNYTIRYKQLHTVWSKIALCTSDQIDITSTEILIHSFGVMALQMKLETKFWKIGLCTFSLFIICTLLLVISLETSPLSMLLYVTQQNS